MTLVLNIHLTTKRDKIIEAEFRKTYYNEHEILNLQLYQKFLKQLIGQSL